LEALLLVGFSNGIRFPVESPGFVFNPEGFLPESVTLLLAVFPAVGFARPVFP
jgi:hypothetical protein